MEHLSNHIKHKDFINVDVVKGTYHSKLGKRPDVLYLNLEPYNRRLTGGYIDHLIDLIDEKKYEIMVKFDVKWIVIDDIMSITI